MFTYKNKWNFFWMNDSSQLFSIFESESWLGLSHLWVGEWFWQNKLHVISALVLSSNFSLFLMAYHNQFKTPSAAISNSIYFENLGNTLSIKQLALFSSNVFRWFFIVSRYCCPNTCSITSTIVFFQTRIFFPRIIVFTHTLLLATDQREDAVRSKKRWKNFTGQAKCE
jgi:hypothetical protein